MDDLSVIFRTVSVIEANVVRGLLETHGFETIQSADAPHAILPLSLDGPGEVRLSVRADVAGAAARVIADFREEVDARLVLIRDECAALEATLSYRFSDRGLLEHALTHRSRAHEDASGGVADNESLEFLGDAVLGLVIADLLFREFPEHDEGWKSKLKATLVSAPTLARLGEQLDLGVYLLLGRGEEKSGGRRKPSLLADTFEAVIAAIYLDGGLSAAAAFIEARFRPALDDVRARGALDTVSVDAKSALQEWLQGRGRPLPEYRLVAEAGPDHRKVFTVDVRAGGDEIARGEGRSKKEAEQQAARRALEVLDPTSPSAADSFQVG